jgi:tRNA threonylcarbamoyladenosine biosynthesis protein TsaE
MIATGEYRTESAEETFELAFAIGERLAGGEIFLLRGDLGAGKTVFTKGLAAGLEIDPAEVTSPTFTLVNRHEGRLNLYHLDLYRLEDATTVLHDLGWEEMLDDRRAVIVIEWPERLARTSLPLAFDVEIVEIIDGDGGSRRLSIVLHSWRS